MRLLITLLLCILPLTSYAQCPVTGNDICTCASLPTTAVVNPELKVLIPWENGPYFGLFMVETKNLTYLPELATNPATSFNVGVDALGDELRPNEGHIHGWLFRVDKSGYIIRQDDPPTPRAYLRFYGAGGAEFYGDGRVGLYVKRDDLRDLKRGRYRIYFQAQHNDHTALTQTNAPAFPPVATRDFWIW